MTDRKTRGWKMNTCVPSFDYSGDNHIHFSCTRPSTGGPWTLHAAIYGSGDSTCSGPVIGIDTVDDTPATGGCDSGITLTCVTDPHPHETTDVANIRTEWYLATTDCYGKVNPWFFRTQTGCASYNSGNSRFAKSDGYDIFYNSNCNGIPMYSKPYEYYHPDINNQCALTSDTYGLMYEPGLSMSPLRNFFPRTVAGPKPPSSCPLDLHTLSSSVRLTRQKWLTDEPPSYNPGRRALKSAESTSSSSTPTLPIATSTSVSVSIVDTAPSSTHVCNNFEVRNRNVLSLRSVIQSASENCINLVLTLDTKKDDFDVNNKFVTITIVSEGGERQQLFDKRRPLFTDGDVVKSLTPYSPGVHTFKVDLQVDFNLESVQVPYGNDYYVEVKISYEDSKGNERFIDCVAVHH